MTDDITEIHWASRVNPAKIRRLYEQDARGMVDEDLVYEVGYDLYARCQSILTATEAHDGRVKCPRCGNIILRTVGLDELLHCERCNWEVMWHDYFKTYQDRHLHGGGALVTLKTYIVEFDNAKTYPSRILAIDRLIHAFHWELVQDPGRTVAKNLIYAKNTKELLAFLDNLAYGDASTPELKKTKAEWQRKLEISGQR